MGLKVVFSGQLLSPRAGGHGSQSVSAQGGALGSPKCCMDEDGSRTIWEHKEQLGEFLCMY